MYKKSLLLLCCIVFVGCQKRISENTDKSLIERLENSSWKIIDSEKQNTIEFSKGKLRVRAGYILGAPSTEYEILGQSTNYVLLSVYRKYGFSMMGIKLIDSKTIKALIWEEKTTPSTLESLKLVEENGNLFKIQ